MQVGTIRIAGQACEAEKGFRINPRILERLTWDWLIKEKEEMRRINEGGYKEVSDLALYTATIFTGLSLLCIYFMITGDKFFSIKNIFGSIIVFGITVATISSIRQTNIDNEKFVELERRMGNFYQDFSISARTPPSYDDTAAHATKILIELAKDTLKYPKDSSDRLFAQTLLEARFETAEEVFYDDFHHDKGIAYFLEQAKSKV